MNIISKAVPFLLLTLFLGLLGRGEAFAADKVVVIALGDSASASAQRQTSFVTGQLNSSVNSGLVPQRTLDFTKASATSDLRISYTDNFRVLRSTGGGYCGWEILINDVSCPSGALEYKRFDNTDQIFLSSSTLVGYCQGLDSGVYSIDVFVTNPSGGDCFTGWESTFLLEVEEVN